MLAGMGRGRTTDRVMLSLLIAGAVGCDKSSDNGHEVSLLDATVAQRGDGGSGPAWFIDAARPALDASDVPYSSLIDNLDWRRYDAAVDPLKSHQPLEIKCFESATYVEYGAFEVDTTRCNYLLAYTPALREVPAGTVLRFSLLHYDLLAPQPAEAHVALLFGNELQWEQTIPIPAAGDQVETTFRSTVALSFQDPIRLHLHNHGGNTYLLVALEAPE
jgi:hypothetical protein